MTPRRRGFPQLGRREAESKWLLRRSCRCLEREHKGHLPHLGKVVWNLGNPCKTSMFSSTGVGLDGIEGARGRCYARHFPARRADEDGVDYATELSAESVWNTISDRLRGALGEQTFATWFAQAQPLSL